MLVSKTHSGLWLPVLLVCVLFFFGCGAPPGTVGVTEVIDGDTIVIEGGYRVRYIGIDTPELYPQPEAYGVEAWQLNRQLVEGKRVRLERDVSETDRYSRLLRYVYVDGIFVNGELVREGLARARAYPPDTKYQDYLEELEQQARLKSKGIWAE